MVLPWVSSSFFAPSVWGSPSQPRRVQVVQRTFRHGGLPLEGIGAMNLSAEGEHSEKVERIRNGTSNFFDFSRRFQMMINFDEASPKSTQGQAQHVGDSTTKRSATCWVRI